MVEEHMEGDVVMVRLGEEGGGMDAVEAEEQGSYVELKPSTTLLVPVELMEGQDGLVGSSQLDLHELHQNCVPDEPVFEHHSSFSLMLEVEDEVNKEADQPPMKNDQELSDPPTVSPLVEAADEPVDKPEVILLDRDGLESGEAHEQMEEPHILGAADVDGAVADEGDLQIQNINTNPEPDDAKAPVEAQLAEEQSETACLLDSEPSPGKVLQQPAAESVAERGSGDELMRIDDEKTEALADQEEPEENGPVDVDTEVETAEEQQDHKASETEEDDGETKTETETKWRGRQTQQKNEKEEKPVSDNQVEEEPVLEMPVSQRKKTAPSTPTRRTTRGKAVAFISPPPQEAEEPQEDGKVAEAESSTLAPASPHRTPRKSKQDKEVKEQATPPRRSTRRIQQQVPEDEKHMETIDHDTTVSSTSKSPSPVRRRVSRRVASMRSSRSGDQEVSSATEVVINEDDIVHTKPSRQASSKTPTPSKRRTTQGSTPRRSSRRILGSTEVVPLPLEILTEENEQEEAFTSAVKHSSQTAKPEPAEMQPAVLAEEEEHKQQMSSPGRRTRQSSRNTLNFYPQVRTQSCKLVMINEVKLHLSFSCLFSSLLHAHYITIAFSPDSFIMHDSIFYFIHPFIST